MFSRRFMKEFPIRKYGRVSAPHGTINTDAYLMGPRDYIPYRALSYTLVTLVTVMAYSNFEVFYELFHHFPGPKAEVNYLSSVPESVRSANDQIINNFEKLNQGKAFVKQMTKENQTV